MLPSYPFPFDNIPIAPYTSARLRPLTLHPPRCDASASDQPRSRDIRVPLQAPARMQHNVMTMNERSVLDTVQRWRRTKYSARPFALTLLAITLITVLAWAKQRGEAPDSDILRKREVTILDEEVQHRTPSHTARTDYLHSAALSTMPPTNAPSCSPTAPTRKPASSPT